MRFSKALTWREWVGKRRGRGDECTCTSREHRNQHETCMYRASRRSCRSSSPLSPILSCLFLCCTALSPTHYCKLVSAQCHMSLTDLPQQSTAVITVLHAWRPCLDTGAAGLRASFAAPPKSKAAASGDQMVPQPGSCNQGGPRALIAALFNVAPLEALTAPPTEIEVRLRHKEKLQSARKKIFALRAMTKLAADVISAIREARMEKQALQTKTAKGGGQLGATDSDGGGPNLPAGYSIRELVMANLPTMELHQHGCRNLSSLPNIVSLLVGATQVQRQRCHPKAVTCTMTCITGGRRMKLWQRSVRAPDFHPTIDRQSLLTLAVCATG